MKTLKLNSVILICTALLVVAYSGLSAQTLRYGGAYHIKNLYGGGTYLDTCGHASKCSSSTKYNVSTSTSKNRDSGSGIWTIESAQGKSGPVSFGDVIYLKNKYGGGTYLDSCGHASACSSTTKYNVTTNASRDRAGQRTGQWVLVSASGKTGTVSASDAVHIKNLYGGGTYLDTCGTTRCSDYTKYAVTTNSSPDRYGDRTGIWAFQSTSSSRTITGKFVVTISLDYLKCIKSGDGNGDATEYFGTIAAGDNRYLPNVMYHSQGPTIDLSAGQKKTFVGRTQTYDLQTGGGGLANIPTEMKFTCELYDYDTVGGNDFCGSAEKIVRLKDLGLGSHEVYLKMASDGDQSEVRFTVNIARE